MQETTQSQNIKINLQNYDSADKEYQHQITDQTREPPQFGQKENPVRLGDGDSDSWLEIFPQVLFIAFIVFLVIYSAIYYDDIIDFFSLFVDWVRQEPITSSLAIVVVYVLLILFTFPILYLTVALGFAFSRAFDTKVGGYFYGLIVITAAIELGGMAVLLLSRYWLSKTIKRRCLSNHRSFLAINHIINKEGFRTVLLLRLTPFPFSIVSYFLGITSVKLKDYSLGSLVITVYVALWLYIGMSLDKFSEIKKKTDQNESAYIEYVVLMFEIIMTFFVGFFISYKAKIFLDKKIEKENNEEVVELKNFQNHEYDDASRQTPEFIKK